MAGISFVIPCKVLKIAQNAEINQLFQFRDVVRIGHLAFNRP